MGTFKAYIKKEFLEASRQYKYVILAVGILFFAISDPIMLKLLPQILKQQLHGDMSSLFTTNQIMAMQNYIKDLCQVGIIFVVFSVSSCLNEEIVNQKLVFPYSKGCNPNMIIISKIINYVLTICTLIILGFAINYMYVGVLFKSMGITFSQVMISALLMSAYYTFNIVLAVLISSITKKGITAGFITLVIGYFLMFLDNIHSISKFMPYKLVSDANKFNGSLNMITILSVLLCSIAFISLTIYRIKRIDII